MEITDIVVHTLSVDEVEGEKADGSQDACIVEVETDEGITGVGEADSSPLVVKAIVEAPVSHDKSAGLKEVLLGRDPFDVEALWNEMYDRTYFFGRRGAAITAMSAVDMAMWDVVGKATDRPLYQLIGGKHRDSVRAYASTLFPAEPTDLNHVREEAGQALDDGFSAIKFGWGGFGRDRVQDLELVGAARDVLGPEFDLMVDAGMVWQGDVKRAIKGINELDSEHDLYWVEEPVYADNLDGYAAIADACETRIVGGEEEYTAYGFREFVDRGRPDAVQPDVARSGGITHMRKIADIAAGAGIPFVPHGYSTDVIVAANLQLIAATRNAPLLEYCVEESPLRWDLVEEDFTAEDGRVEVPDRPGLGVTLDRDVLEEYRTDLPL
ncbi:mandelate racemase/muconate lactonizing enzyme family protein [Halorarum halophilum]|uniref:Mandelate racemase/muconate lactonizing enzyme family protein n=1 Tax=Halorarum halophilum TaxID=2743090 RepID=A0A7D5GH78_9EURY|nr:mandelate racemase/muconate lactonizing enzyme family protein [Halobaculum halophilum]QLG27291.1 mandelate racemase/muconate lactonizing enzyme family protein [Halobaculum halophilum]